MTAPRVEPLTELAFVTHARRSGALSTIVECRWVPRSDTAAPPIRGARRERPALQNVATGPPLAISVRSGGDPAGRGRALSSLAAWAARLAKGSAAKRAKVVLANKIAWMAWAVLARPGGL
jgi:hypothetical protein